MRSLLYLFLLSFISFTFALTKGRYLVNDICKAAKHDDKDVSYGDCYARLMAIPENLRADDVELGLSMLKLVYTSIFEGRQKILQILQDTKLEDSSRDSLSRCLDYYKDGIEDLNQAIILYKAKDYTKVDIRVADSVVQTAKCESTFEENRLKSPLTEKYNEIRKLSEIAIDVVILVEA